MGVLSNCEPVKLFEYFEWLASVPHGSGNTDQISELCVSFAKEHGFKYVKDDLNNVVIFKPGSKGYENSEPVILQGHMDMVCAKEESCDIDMTRDGLKVQTDGEWVWADGTSLGADNGVAVASILAILDDDTIDHPPIEAAFTVDEETGMDGAAGLDVSVLKAKRLINMDSEEEGVFTVSCAGGVRVNCSLGAKRERASDDDVFFDICISGLLGGHSGVDIDKGHANANKLMARILLDTDKAIGIKLSELSGGTLDNVITLRADAKVAVHKDDADKFVGMVKEYDKIFKNEFSASDPNVCVDVAKAEASEEVVVDDDKKNIIFAMVTVPNGIEEMSFDIKGLVQTSLNLGITKLAAESFNFSFAVRSMFVTQKDMLVDRITAIVEKLGGSVSLYGDYPGWEFDRDSKLLELTKAVYREQAGEDGIVSAIHGGLECGLFINKMPGLDCISIGPELHDVHSTRERLHVQSTERMHKLVIEMLKRMR